MTAIIVKEQIACTRCKKEGTFRIRNGSTIAEGEWEQWSATPMVMCPSCLKAIGAPSMKTKAHRPLLTAWLKGWLDSKSGLPVSACPYAGHATGTNQFVFKNQFRVNWIKGYESARRVTTKTSNLVEVVPQS